MPVLHKKKIFTPVIESVYRAKDSSDEFIKAQLVFDPVKPSSPKEITLEQPAVSQRQELKKHNDQKHQNQTKLHKSSNKSGSTENLLSKTNGKKAAKYASTPDLLASANGSKFDSQSNLGLSPGTKQAVIMKHHNHKSEPGTSKGIKKPSGYGTTKSEIQATRTKYPIVMKVGIDHVQGQPASTEGTSKSLLKKIHLKKTSLDGGGMPGLKSKRQFQRHSQEMLKRASEEFELKFNNPSPSNVCLDDFKLIKTLGTGAFGRVMLVTLRKTGKYYAMKILQKTTVVQGRQIEHTVNEMKVLQAISYPFMVYLKYHFKDYSNLYMVMEHVPGGEMFHHLRRKGHFNEILSRFYAAQLLMALEYLHNLNIVFRDLKPENILISSDGYLKLTDFGFAKQIKYNRTWTICGTTEYLAPEIMANKGYGKAVDWWALGILIYEMMAGFPPYSAENPLKMYEKIKSSRVIYPRHFSADVKDLIGNLLQVDATRRYGSGYSGVEEIRDHKWFALTNWMAIYKKRERSSLIPDLQHEGDTRHFDNTKEDLSLFKHQDRDLYPDEFKDF